MFTGNGENPFLRPVPVSCSINNLTSAKQPHSSWKIPLRNPTPLLNTPPLWNRMQEADHKR